MQYNSIGLSHCTTEVMARKLIISLSSRTNHRFSQRKWLALGNFFIESLFR